MATPLPITGGFYVSESLPISNQQLINWYVNIVQSAGLSQETIFGTPGIVQIVTTGTIKQENRGGHDLDKKPYFVNGDKLYRINRIDTAGVITFEEEALGTIDGEKRVSMASNGIQLMIVTNGQGWIYTVASGLVEIDAAGFTANGTPETVSFILSYFVCTTDTKKAIISSQNDGTVWNALDFISAESDPDPLSASIEFNDQLFLFGSITTQVAVTIQTAGVPLQIQTGFKLSKGISAPNSVVEANDTFLWIGAGKNESPAIWKFTGSTAEKVSTTAIDTILQGFTEEEISTSFALSYAQKGAYFVNFYLPTTCLSYNTITERWNEVQSTVEDSQGLVTTIRSRVNSIVTAYGLVLVGDSQDGRIGALNPSVFTEYGREIKRTLVTQPFSAQGSAVRVPMLELTMEAGVGNDDVTDPKISMATSKDGKTFRDSLTRSVGKVGESNRRTIWRKLGRFPRFAVFKFVYSAKAKPVIIKLEANMKASR